MKFKNSLFILILITLLSPAKGQDLHFSNFTMSPGLVNPALIATSSEFKTTAGSRKQWNNIADPFLSYSINSSYPIVNRKNLRRAAVGISFLNMKSGIGGAYKISDLSGILAYNLKVSPSYHLAFAVKAGFVNKSYSLSHLATGDQWNPSGYDPNLPNGEDKGTISFWNPNLSASVLWYRILSGKLNYFAGVSLANLNRADENAISKTKTPVGISIIGGFNLIETSSYIIAPRFQYLTLSKSKNILTGSNFDYKINSGKGYIKNGTAGVGVFYRYNDAIVFTAQLNQPSYTVGFSYDHNASSLSKNLNFTNATELFLTYKIPVTRKSKAKKLREIPVKIPAVSNEEKLTYVQIKVYNMEDSSSAVNATFNLIELHKGTNIVSDSIELPEKLHQLKLILPQDKDFEIIAINPGFFPHTEKIETNKDSIFIEAKLNPIHDGDLLVFDNIIFAPKEATIDSSSYIALNEIYKILKLNPGIKVEIAGHTDDTGTKRHNLRLSQERANAIADFLLKAGIAKDRIVPVGYGEESPLIKEKTDAARAKNRRVELKILEH